MLGKKIFTLEKFLIFFYLVLKNTVLKRLELWYTGVYLRHTKNPYGITPRGPIFIYTGLYFSIYKITSNLKTKIFHHSKLCWYRHWMIYWYLIWNEKIIRKKYITIILQLLCIEISEFSQTQLIWLVSNFWVLWFHFIS